MADALVMAGGRSARMRAGGNTAHKALVEVAGIPLAEWAVRMLLIHGFLDIAISVNATETEVAGYIQERLCRFASTRRAKIELIIEAKPLGTIGAAREIAEGPDTLLVVNVDNLTSLNLRGLVEYHRAAGAAMTVACHTEEFRIPFGEVTHRSGFVERYAEKPSHRICISSGTYVLGLAAIACIRPAESIGAPDLCERLQSCGEQVAAYAHDDPWIDVNDPDAVMRAEALVDRHRDLFRLGDRWT